MQTLMNLLLGATIGFVLGIVGCVLVAWVRSLSLPAPGAEPSTPSRP